MSESIFDWLFKPLDEFNDDDMQLVREIAVAELIVPHKVYARVHEILDFMEKEKL